MFPAFDSLELTTRLLKLNQKQQLAFGASCCERMLPSYLAFQEDSGWGNFETLRRGLDFVWSALENDGFSLKEAEKLLDQCDETYPDSADFESLYVPYAQDAYYVIGFLLDVFLGYEIDAFVEIATYTIQTVEMYVQETEQLEPTDPDIESKILNHRIMQRELAQQESDLKEIERNSEVSLEFIQVFRHSWGNNGKSNIDLPIT